jgi:hypothetical protein
LEEFERAWRNSAPSPEAVDAVLPVVEDSR